MNNPYYKDEWVTHYCADALTVLSGLPDEGIDLLATDPPYGIGFMGKEWDKFNEIVDPQGAYAKKKGFKKLPRQNTTSMTEFFVPIWTECLRVLRAGAFAFVMCSPRADVMAKQINALQDAGFLVNFTPIYWAYASGFPKAQNIGKMVDKRGANSPDDLREFKHWFHKQIDKSSKTQEQINNECGFTATSYYKTDGKDYWTSAFPTPEKWLVIKKVMGLSDDWDWLIKRYDKERGWLDNPTGGLAQSNLTPFTGRQLKNEPYTPQAKALEGSYGGFQPKPAVEVIIVAMKPLSEKTFVDQALKNRKGITWLDNGRIPISAGDRHEYGVNGDEPSKTGMTGVYGEYNRVAYQQNSKGRFPANLLVSDDVLNDGRVSKSNTRQPTGHQNIYDVSKGWNQNRVQDTTVRGMQDSGSFSRYFDLDKWWAKTFPFLIVPKASKSEKNKGLGDIKPQQVTDGRSIPPDYPSQRGQTIRHNLHPTVKPLKLMSYLITLGSRAGDTVLDPFLGSGTTALACELLNRKCIGIEIEEKYCEIAARRCSQQVMNLSKYSL